MEINISGNLMKRIIRIKRNWENPIDFIIRIVSDKVSEIEREREELENDRTREQPR